MVKTISALTILAFCTISSAQQSPIRPPAPTTMVKLEVRLQSPDAPEGSFSAQPKTMYRASTGYCRLEEAPDPKNGIHGLLILHEPDAWMVNLASKSARHIVDTEPPFFCRLPMFSDDQDKSQADPKLRVSALEFGRELEYFKSMGAVPDKGPVLQGQQTTAYLISLGPTILTLFTYGSSQFPLAVVRKVGDKSDIWWYSGYGRVPFDPKLFAKPEGIKIEEQKP
jgi:hypothetical protein